MPDPVSLDPTEIILTDDSRRKFASATPFHHALQRRHFFLFEVLPFIGTVVAITMLFWQPIGALELGLFFGLWYVSGFGITLAYHRHLAHRAFKAKPWLRTTLMLMAFLATQGPPLSWTAFHRLHHGSSDEPGDPHSPNLHGKGFFNRLKGLLHAQVMWMYRHDYPGVTHFIPDLARDRLMLKLDRYYLPVALAGIAFPAVVGALYYQTWLGAFTCFLWGAMVRLFVCDHLIWHINSVLHTFGKRRFQTGDESRNGYFMSIITLGESFHNNHHAFPGSADFGLGWHRPDPAYWVLKLMEQFGWVWDVRVPSKQRIQQKTRSKA
jgi:stearoyl-CoA desaturase (delta-9 desaturase)